MDFLSQMEAILAATSEQETTSDLSTDSARLQALQIRQQLELQPHGIANRASQLALALFR
jgi:flagellin-like hook-associated protein FlgL